MSTADMGSPPSGPDGPAPKVAKDRNCPFCGQAFTSSSLGRHLDLYIKPKNPKPADGVHDVNEIRRMRGNITRRQSRITSIRKDSSTSVGPASAKYVLDEGEARATQSPIDVQYRIESQNGVKINKMGWEATGVMTDLPPRRDTLQPDRRDSRKEQLKENLDQRQKLMEELDAGRAAQLALKEVLDSIRAAQTSSTGRDLYDFDFLKSSFPTLCIRVLSPVQPSHTSLPELPSEAWSLDVPGDRHRDALLNDVEHRGRLLRQASSSNSTAGQLGDQPNLDRFRQHIRFMYDQWRLLSDSDRIAIWHGEVLRSYIGLRTDLVDAQNTVTSLRREVENLEKRLDRAHHGFTGSLRDHYPPLPSLTSTRLSEDSLRDLCKQGLHPQWDYNRLVDKWKIFVKEERRSSSGMSAQRQFSTSSEPLRQGANNSSLASRSASVTSAMSHVPPTRTTSIGSGSHDADAEGEEDDDNIAPDAPAPPPRHANPGHLNTTPSETNANIRAMQQQAAMGGMPRLANLAPQAVLQSPMNGDYRWPQATVQASAGAYEASPNVQRMKHLPPGPDSWRDEFAQAVGTSMEGVEGPAGVASTGG